MPSLFDEACRAETLARLRRLTPESERRWGTMTAPRMVAHLIDQMSHTLGDKPVAPMPGLIRNPVMKFLVLYVIPWPKGRIKGPPEAFLTQPSDWAADVAKLEDSVNRLAKRGPGGAWPDHPKFGPMSGKDWGVFCAKHFDHHLRQFGV